MDLVSETIHCICCYTDSYFITVWGHEKVYGW